MSVSVLRSPAPAASRGGPNAREQAPFLPTTEIFNAHGKLENHRSHRLWLGTAQWNFRPTFFTPIFRGRALGRAPLVGTTGPHRRTADADGADPRPQGAGPGSMGVGEVVCQRNQTSNQTSGGSLVSWPRLPRFGSFPFRFPFRGEKGSAPSAGAPRGPGEGGRGWGVLLQPP